jgi:hypothetical protein
VSDDVGPLAPTARICWVTRPGPRGTAVKVLVQWFAPDVPTYMQNGQGEWRDVPTTQAAQAAST